MSAPQWQPVGQAGNATWRPLGNVKGPPGDSWENLPYTMHGELRPDVGEAPYPIAGGPFTIETVTAMVGSAPLLSDAVIDVLVNGASIYADPAARPRIPAGQRRAVVGVPALREVTDGDYFTVAVVEVGTVPARALTVVIRLRRDGAPPG